VVAVVVKILILVMIVVGKGRVVKIGQTKNEINIALVGNK